jgi:hypothetical protein
VQFRVEPTRPPVPVQHVWVIVNAAGACAAWSASRAWAEQIALLLERYGEDLEEVEPERSSG